MPIGGLPADVVARFFPIAPEGTKKLAEELAPKEDADAGGDDTSRDKATLAAVAAACQAAMQKELGAAFQARAAAAAAGGATKGGTKAD